MFAPQDAKESSSIMQVTCTHADACCLLGVRCGRCGRGGRHRLRVLVVRLASEELLRVREAGLDSLHAGCKRDDDCCVGGSAHRPFRLGVVVPSRPSSRLQTHPASGLCGVDDVVLCGHGTRLNGLASEWGGGVGVGHRARPRGQRDASAAARAAPRHPSHTPPATSELTEPVAVAAHTTSSLATVAPCSMACGRSAAGDARASRFTRPTARTTPQQAPPLRCAPSPSAPPRP